MYLRHFALTRLPFETPTVVFHIPSWDPHGNGSDYSVDGFPGMTKQSGNRSERVRSPVARIVA